MVQPRLKLVQGMVLFVFLDKPKPEFPDEVLPFLEGERVFCGLALGSALCHILRHEGHGKANGLLLGQLPGLVKRFRKEPEVRPDGVEE